jgi:hypothetical protein
MLTDQLLEEIEAGQGETLTIAARRLPRTRKNKPVTLSCLFRWIMTGVIGLDGQRVYLEAARLAGRWVTTPKAIRRFVAAQTPADRGDPERLGSPTALRCSPSKRLKAAKRAGVELEKHGIR